VILADTSAWVEYLRATGSPANRRLRQLIAERGDLVTTDVVVMEVLAGAGTEERAGQLRRLLNRFELVPVAGLADFESAAGIYRRCQRGGETVRALNDCLIAAVALRSEAEVLHRDRGYEVIARHTPLRILATA
jgi:predicted nucleic acid-binding protein